MTSFKCVGLFCLACFTTLAVEAAPQNRLGLPPSPAEVAESCVDSAKKTGHEANETAQMIAKEKRTRVVSVAVDRSQSDDCGVGYYQMTFEDGMTCSPLITFWPGQKTGTWRAVTMAGFNCSYPSQPKRSLSPF